MKKTEQMVNISIMWVLLASMVVSVHAYGTSTNKVKKLPMVKSLRQDSRQHQKADPSALVKIVVGWDKPARSCSEVRNALAALKRRERNEDLSEADQECLLSFGIALNGQYKRREFPDEIKLIKADIHELIAASLYLPKPVRDKISPGLLPLAREMAEVSRTDFNADVREKYRVALAGKEKIALEYAFGNVASSLDGRESIITPLERSQNEACLKFMLLLEDETLAYYQDRVASKEGLTTREKVGLREWGRFVEHPEAFRLMIDILIDDWETAPHEECWEQIDAPLRFCDMAYSTAQYRIGGSHVWTQRSALKTRERNENIAEFKVWWETNRDNFELSIGKRKARLKKRPSR